MLGMCSVCGEKVWIVIRRVFFIRQKLCADCFMDCRKLLPKGITR